ncbi:MAG: hypothetical protein KatS3mg031_2349 [Chitinophagales bacterium]|nr:MAG: hypothetical protein KatS3mg031_2349 [Chitinophagales bacterium]
MKPLKFQLVSYILVMFLTGIGYCYSAAVVCYAPGSCFYTNGNCEDFQCYNDQPPTCTCNPLSSPVQIEDEYSNSYQWQIIEDQIFQVRPEGGDWVTVTELCSFMNCGSEYFKVHVICEFSRIVFKRYNIACIDEYPPAWQGCLVGTENIHYEFCQ